MKILVQAENGVQDIADVFFFPVGWYND